MNSVWNPSRKVVVCLEEVQPKSNSCAVSINPGVLNGQQVGGYGWIESVIEKYDQGGVTVRRRTGEGSGKAVTGDPISGETEIVCESMTMWTVFKDDGRRWDLIKV